MSTLQPMMLNQTDEWLTPSPVIAAVGPFDLDPCAHPEFRTRCADVGFCLPDENGLLLPWHGRVWCNPPFGRELPKWIERMALHGNGIMLAPARTETRWFRVAWQSATAILFPYKRFRYERPDGTAGENPTFPDALIAFGRDNAKSLSQSRNEIRGALVWGVTA
jgi:hypothetical protein